MYLPNMSTEALSSPVCILVMIQSMQIPYFSASTFSILFIPPFLNHFFYSISSMFLFLLLFLSEKTKL
jgi:DNA topoisomerase VI subunit B